MWPFSDHLGCVEDVDEKTRRQTSDNTASHRHSECGIRKVVSIQNAVSVFKKAGLWSLAIDIFQGSDFAAAMVTKVITEAAQEHNPTPPLTSAVAAPALTAMEAVPELCPPKKETS